NVQILRGLTGAARAALGAARETLQGAALTDEHLRLAGWISISELSRRAGDLENARESVKEALRFLRALEPVPRRAEYARGGAAEVRLLEGSAASAEVLREATAWAALI